MNLDKSNMKKIMLLVALTVLLLWAMMNYTVVLMALGYIIGLCSPLLLGFCIAFVLNVILRTIEDKLFIFIDRRTGSRLWRGARRPLSIILSLGVVCGIIFFVINLVVPEVKNTATMLAEQVPGYVEKCAAWLSAVAAENGMDSINFNEIMERYAELKDSVMGLVKNVFSESFGIINSAISTTISVFSGIFNGIMGVIFSIYILLRKETLSRQAKQILYAYTPKRFADEALYVGRLSNKMFTNFVTGQFMEAIIIGLLCFIGMSLLKFPYAPMISVLVGFTALIPVFGAFIGTGIGAFLILMVEPIQALWFILFIIVLQQLEGNLIYPHVVGSSVGLPGIWVMLAVLVGGDMGGIVGMLIGVPLASVLYSLIARGTHGRLARKGINIEEK